jgi:hypothetical protein
MKRYDPSRLSAFKPLNRFSSTSLRTGAQFKSFKTPEDRARDT